MKKTKKPEIVKDGDIKFLRDAYSTGYLELYRRLKKEQAERLQRGVFVVEQLHWISNALDTLEHIERTIEHHLTDAYFNKYQGNDSLVRVLYAAWSSITEGLCRLKDDARTRVEANTTLHANIAWLPVHLGQLHVYASEALKAFEKQYKPEFQQKITDRLSKTK